MTTAYDLISLSLKEAGVIGVGQSPQDEDFNDALTLLNGMMGQWQRRRWLVYHLIDVICQGTGALSYSIGPGGDFNVARTDKIEAAYFRQTAQSPNNNNVDYPLTPIWSREEYNDIALKSLASFPQVYFYDSAWPLGYVYIWPLPSSLYEIHLSIKDTLQTFPSLTTEINLPPEYFEALHYNLAVRLRPMYQLPPDMQIVQLAKLALNTIKNANAQIPSLRMPSDLSRGGIYNVYGDFEY
jgi:hypothetical protein